MTQPVDLPMHGRLPKLTYQKEELVELWQQVATKNRLPVRLGVTLNDLTRDENGVFIATTSEGVFHARNVCLAVGRRGSPRKLGVAKGAAYHNRFCSIIHIDKRKIAHWRDYMDSLAAWNAWSA